MAAKGFKVMAVDQKSNRHKQLFPTISIDLADDEAVQYLISLLTKPGAVFYLHCAPPCGTASRARERRLSFALRKRGVKEPKPLRSSSHPHGLPHLQGVELRRVTTANSVYRNVAAVCRAALKAGCYVSIENPSRSYMWETEWMLSLIAEFQLQEIKFQQCMWGSKRDKWTSFFSSCQWLSFLAVSCDGSHSHAAWGVTFQDGGYSFNTAQEAEYPHKLCLAIANAAYDHALKSGCFVANKKTKLNNGLPSSMSAAAGWTLPPPRKTPRMLTSDELQTLQLQAPSKILSYLPSGDATDESKTPSAKIGVYRTCDKFMEEAIKLKHPFDDSSSVDEHLKQNIFDLMTLGCDEVARRRQLTIDYYASRKAELSEAEAVIHGALHPRRRRLVEDKAFLLFREMCVDAGIDDPELCDLLVNGTPLVGKSGSSNLFEAEDNIPAMSDVQLMKSSRWSRKMLSGRKTHGAADPHVEAEIWKGALEESEKGWLCGPMTEQEVIDKYGPLFVASPRFGLQQTDKVRPIDDMSVSLVNSSFSASYKLSLDGVDGISILSRTFLEAVSEDRQVCIPMSGGCYLKGVLHPSLTVDDARNLFGRTLDLEAAYKQMLVRESSLWASILLINEPGVGGRFFASEVLPFGASASVYSFNRVSRAIRTIGARLFSLIWACYYDDFLQVDIGKSGGNAQVIAEKLLDLIGWRYSCKESKRQPFWKTFSALGVVFDFSLANEKKIVVRNKDSRVDQVCSEIDKILECGSFSTPQASSLRGRLQYAESQTFGRAVALHMKACHARSIGADSSTLLSPDLKSELLWAKEFVSCSPPRLLRARMSGSRVVIFTDASLSENDEVAGVGMVMVKLVDDEVSERAFFSEKVPLEVLAKLQERTPKVICALELLAAVQAVMVCEKAVLESRTFLFVDNEATRANLIAMNSPVVIQSRLLKKLFEFSMAKSMFVWTSRVPSMSNPADDPSRFVVQKLVDEGFTRFSLPWNLVE